MSAVDEGPRDALSVIPEVLNAVVSYLRLWSISYKVRSFLPGQDRVVSGIDGRNLVGFGEACGGAGRLVLSFSVR